MLHIHTLYTHQHSHTQQNKTKLTRREGRDKSLTKKKQTKSEQIFFLNYSFTGKKKHENVRDVEAWQMFLFNILF